MRILTPLLALLVLAPLGAQSPWSQELDLDTFVSKAPDGLQLNGAYSLRKVLSGSRAEPNAYVQLGAVAASTPAYGFGGLFVEAQPAPFLVLRAERSALRFFGTAGCLLSFPTASAPFGDDAVKARKGQEERTNGARTLLQATPQVRFGQVVLRHQATFGWWQFSGRGPWFYEYENDTLLHDHDRTSDQQSFALWESDWGSLKSYCGGTFQVTRASDAGLERRRIGLVLSFEAKESGGRWGQPRGGLIIGRNQTDPNRKGELYATCSLGTSWTIR